jgi:hypothetical protein
VVGATSSSPHLPHQKITLLSMHKMYPSLIYHLRLYVGDPSFLHTHTIHRIYIHIVYIYAMKFNVISCRAI